MCDETFIGFNLFHSVLNQYKTQEVSDRVVAEDPSMVIYCPNRYKTQKSM